MGDTGSIGNYLGSFVAKAGNKVYVAQCKNYCSQLINTCIHFIEESKRLLSIHFDIKYMKINEYVLILK